MKFGLSDSEFSFLNKNLFLPLKHHKAKVFIFGSRATGKHHKFSDVDVLFIEHETHPIPSSVIAEILTLFEDSNFPYKIDLVNNKSLAKSYRANIEATKVEI